MWIIKMGGIYTFEEADSTRTAAAFVLQLLLSFHKCYVDFMIACVVYLFIYLSVYSITELFS